ncbi:glycosyltransferase family 4 protein [Enterobacter hormaechei]|nr:glycosyltransferase family 4 protein [Enterobacter hormaechei]
MKILFLSNASGYGGSERTLEIIIKELSSTHEITVIAENEKHVSLLKKNKIQVLSVRKEKRMSIFFKNMRLIFSQVKNNDCVISNTNKAGLYLALLKIFFPSIKTRKILIFVRDFQWKFIRFITFILGNEKFCVANEVVFDYLKKYKVEPYIIPNPVCIPAQKDIADNNNIPVILCPAMISRWKGINFLIEACSYIKQDFELIIIGQRVDNDYFSSLIELIDKLNMTNKVIFVDYTNEIDLYYEKSTVVVSSSISEYGGPETFGRVIIEAWAHKKPVVSFDCGGPSYLINHGHDGILVPEKDTVLLAKALQKIISDKSSARAMGINGYNEIIQSFNSKTVCEKLMTYIDAP